MIKENEDKLLNSDLFKAFLKKDLNRCDFISQWLSAHNVPHSIVNLAQKKHIIIKYPAQFYDKNPIPKQLTTIQPLVLSSSTLQKNYALTQDLTT